MGRAMQHLAIVFAEMERDFARERTLAGLERVRATGKHLGRRKGVSQKRAEEIQQMRRHDGLSWGRIATMTGLPSSSIRWICPEPRGLGDNVTGFRETLSVVAKICARRSHSRLAWKNGTPPDPTLAWRQAHAIELVTIQSGYW